MGRQQAANSTDPTRTIASGPSPQELLTQDTLLTVVQRGHVDGSLSEGILLTEFTEPEDRPRGTLEGSILLQQEGICP